MATITLSIPAELKEKMDKFPNVKWSEVLRSIIIHKVKQLKKFEQIGKIEEL